VWNVIFYSLPEILIMLAAAIMIDWIFGDPRLLPHPVIGIGRLISALERRLHRSNHWNAVSVADDPDAASFDQHAKQQRNRGVLLTVIVTLASGIIVWGICALLGLIHPWLGLAAHTWLISTTIAVKGLKEAAMLVYEPLIKGDLAEARKYVGYIVGRDTADLNESEVSRAAVETVAENTVDALVSPIIYALLGGAPLAMLYRATNTLDSMVGYKNDKYVHFGWASARWDDVMNYIPARICGLLLVLSSWLRMRMSAVNAWRAIRQFARLHPSPNSGIPESAVAGALGIELGGTNRYGDRISERARMGWPRRPLNREDIRGAVKLLYGVSYALVGGCLCGLLITLL
jgi:adenosylcobinamide-phosphate synthase